MNLKERAIKKVDTFKKYSSALFFLLGFVFDLVMLDRIDGPIMLLQQATFLLIIGYVLYLQVKFDNELFIPSEKIEKIWTRRNEIIHFMYGSLLSAYTIFYFKSSSLKTSLIFIILLIGIFIANELPLFRRQNIILKVFLYSFCLITYMIYLVPVLLSFIGVFPFVISVLATIGILLFINWRFLKAGVKKDILLAKWIGPSFWSVCFLILFYIMEWIPPIPLSIQKIGVYHNIEKVEGKYKLYFEKSNRWKWPWSDSLFVAHEGDKIFCFVRIFSPTSFEDDVLVEWHLKNKKNKWERQDSIKMQIRGGRSEGFRGVTYKGNYTFGNWMIKIMTTDRREIGRTYFELVKSEEMTAPQNRKFEVEFQ